jgi:hypothetical protein
MEQLAREAFARSRERRRRLAALSFEEKVEILVRLQELAREVRLAAGRPSPPTWRL